jgi:predicted ATPase/DNA-binding SARP family transcriptional activator/DNA-binding CsgD family transcriptional regulator
MASHRLTAQARSGGIQPEAVRIWLLGGFRISVGSRSVGEDEWRLRKAGSLVKLLALSPGHLLHREQAMDLLWPDLDSEAAANNLHHALHIARRTLEHAAPASAASSYLHLRGERLALCPDAPLWVDVEAFEEAARAARRAREPAAYRAAVELYAGELLPEDRYEAWAEERRDALRETLLALLVELAGLYEEREEYGPAIEALRLALAEDPAREEAHRGLMRLYAASGERRRAIAQYEQLEKTLSEGLDAEPGAASRRLHEEILADRYRSRSESRASKEPAGSSQHNLPNPRTSFVGREREMIGVKRSLAMTGVLTLTGAGGCGKTRLALEVARDLVGAYPDGVWLVELAPLSDPALVPQAVAAALGVREQPGRPLTETLSSHLGSKRTLLVLDNCEHLIYACARLVDALLNSCSGLRVLATSREALGVAGETNWPLSPLALPDTGERLPPVEELARYEAIRLFLERARSRLSAFELTAENARDVAEVCRKLDGIPLGIELATARLSALAVEQIVAMLNDSLRLLTTGARTADPRHRTLRATLEWSYELLDEPERKLFGRLSVFAGGWTLEAAEEVCSGDGQDGVLDLLSQLVDKSLVVAEAGAETLHATSPRHATSLRYRMLEPVRQYAREKLEESGETERVRERHARHYLELAERVEPELSGARPVPWLELLETEYGNLRSALSWALDTDDESQERAEIGLRLAAALARFWDAHSPAEGRRWFEKGLARSGASNTSGRARALNEAGFIAVYEGDPEALPMLEESLALYKELGDRSGVALSMSHLGHAAVHLGQPERMMSLREEAEAMLSEPSEKRVSAHLLMFLGFAAASEFDFEQMEARLEEALALFRELEDVRSISVCLLSLGHVSIGRDDPAGAARFEEALIIQRDLKHQTAIFMGISGMAGVAALRGQPLRSVKLMGASEALREEIGLTSESLSKARYDYEKYLATARAGLGEAAFDVGFSEGQAMSPEQAIEYALSKEEERDPATLVPAPEQQPPADELTERLTRREQEVALCVARGLTNRRIASELAISGRTVENHVRKILKKLGFRSRAQIAAWVAQRR